MPRVVVYTADYVPLGVVRATESELALMRQNAGNTVQFFLPQRLDYRAGNLSRVESVSARVPTYRSLVLVEAIRWGDGAVRQIVRIHDMAFSRAIVAHFTEEDRNRGDGGVEADMAGFCAMVYREALSAARNDRGLGQQVAPTTASNLTAQVWQETMRMQMTTAPTFFTASTSNAATAGASGVNIRRALSDMDAAFARSGAGPQRFARELLEAGVPPEIVRDAVGDPNVNVHVEEDPRNFSRRFRLVRHGVQLWPAPRAQEPEWVPVDNYPRREAMMRDILSAATQLEQLAQERDAEVNLRLPRAVVEQIDAAAAAVGLTPAPTAPEVIQQMDAAREAMDAQPVPAEGRLLLPSDDIVHHDEDEPPAEDDLIERPNQPF